MTAVLAPGSRVVVASGPWPERRGAHGVVVDGPAIYPFHSVTQHECVILLDDDPLFVPFDESRPFAYHADHETWSCVICRRDLVPEPLAAVPSDARDGEAGQ